ncbi:MAG: hypothetical protein N2037_14535, partial [Acidimicrobiales bacterium]|nr:hypothetical protein [Acidimicrobiales bacterium]
MTSSPEQLSAVASARRTARLFYKRLGLLGAPRDHEPAPLSIRAAAVIFILAIVLAYLLVGVWFMVVTAVVALVTLRFNPDPGRPFAFAAFALVFGAMLATIVRPVEMQNGGFSFELPQPGDPTIVFAKVREFASQLGSYAGVFLAIATMMYAVAERSPTVPPERQPSLAARIGAVREFVAAMLRTLVREMPMAAIGVGALVIRLALAPPAVAPSLEGLVRNLRMGYSYSAVSGSIVPDGIDAPLAPVIAAYSPFGPRLVAVGLSLTVVALAGWCAYRWAGRRGALVAAIVAAFMPAIWDQQLSGLAASGCVLAALLLTDPNGEVNRPLGRAAAAGLVCGLAGLARPDALVAVPVVVGWWLSGPSARTVSRAAILIAIAGLTMSPWLNFVWSEFGFGLPTASLHSTLRDPAAITRLPGMLSSALLGLIALVAVVPVSYTHL